MSVSREPLWAHTGMRGDALTGAFAEGHGCVVVGQGTEVLSLDMCQVGPRGGQVVSDRWLGHDPVHEPIFSCHLPTGMRVQMEPLPFFGPMELKGQGQSTPVDSLSSLPMYPGLHLFCPTFWQPLPRLLAEPDQDIQGLGCCCQDFMNRGSH